jgi:inhibitor of KinA sporulation pathway (predicted exonuclease)
MARKLDQILVIDVEATCWEGGPPPGEISDIIEIGVCPVEIATGRRLDVASILVRPERSQVSPFCTALTTITPEQVAAGVPFADACATVAGQYGARDRVWASWGDYDRRQFERQCREMGVEYPFGPTHLNVKTLFALAAQLPHESGMAAALDHLRLPLDGTHHRAGDDAWNIAAILATLILRLRKPVA